MVPRVFAALVLVAVVCSAPAGPWPDARARDLLLKSMKRSRCTDVSAIVVQDSPGGTLQIKLERAEDGFERQTILQPLSMQGVTTVDDGTRWMTLWPDERRVLQQESPRLWQADPEDRIRLADRNYRLTITSEDQIAGRRVLCVSAVPRAKEMATRRYYVDERTAFILRNERVDEDGEVVTLLDTKVISFPREIPKCCEMLATTGMRVIERAPPKSLKSLASVKAVVGFEPVFPKTLPFGFVIHEKQLVGGEGRRLVAVRLTDGLVTATVYEWAAEHDARHKAHSSGVREAGGIMFRVVGDLTDAAKALILSKFLLEVEEALRPALELRGVPSVLETVTRIGS